MPRQLTKNYKGYKIVGISAAAALALLVLIFFVWWLQRDEVPAAVNLETTIAQLQASESSDPSGLSGDSTEPSSSTEASGSTEPSSSDTTDAAQGNSTGPDSSTETNGSNTADTAQGSSTRPGSSDATDAVPGDSDAKPNEPPSQTAGIAGVWTLQTSDSSVDLLKDPAVSFAGFRVDEVLAGGIGDFTAVGRTADVSGELELTDTALVAAEVTVDLTTLRTDNEYRDRRIQQALDTAGFPDTVFTLTEPVELPDQTAFSGIAVGELTIKGTTNSAAFQLDTKLLDGTLVVVGSAPVVFADYGVEAPTAPIVISVEDHGIIEFQLLFTRTE